MERELWYCDRKYSDQKNWENHILLLWNADFELALTLFSRRHSAIKEITPSLELSFPGNALASQPCEWD